MKAEKESMFRNEQGSVLIVTLIMLVLLTLLGITASRTSSIEVQIAGNEKRYRQNIYLAEAGAMQGTQVLEETDLESTSLAWSFPQGGADEDDIRDASFWSSNSQASLNANTRFLAISQGVATGSSLDVSKSQVYVYTVYGRSTQNGGQSIIELGYRKAY